MFRMFLLGGAVIMSGLSIGCSADKYDTAAEDFETKGSTGVILHRTMEIRAKKDTVVQVEAYGIGTMTVREKTDPPAVAHHK